MATNDVVFNIAGNASGLESAVNKSVASLDKLEKKTKGFKLSSQDAFKSDAIKQMTADTEKASAALAMSQKQAAGLASGIGAIKIAVGALAGYVALDALVNAFKLSITAAGDAEQRILKLSAALKVTGQEVKHTVRDFDEFATAMLNTKGVSKDLSLDLAARGISMNLPTDEIKEFISVAADMSKFTGTLESNFELLSRAYNGNAGALKELGTKFGIVMADAMPFRDLVKQIKGQVDGLAAADLSGFFGQWNLLKENVKEFLALFGGPEVAFLADFMKYINNPKAYVGLGVDTKSITEGLKEAEDAFAKAKENYQKTLADFNRQTGKTIGENTEYEARHLDAATKEFQKAADNLKYWRGKAAAETEKTERGKFYSQAGSPGKSDDYDAFEKFMKGRDKASKEAKKSAKLVGSTTLLEVESAIDAANEAWDTFDSSLIEKARDTYDRLATSEFSAEDRAQQKTLDEKIKTLEQADRNHQKFINKIGDREIKLAEFARDVQIKAADDAFAHRMELFNQEQEELRKKIGQYGTAAAPMRSLSPVERMRQGTSGDTEKDILGLTAADFTPNAERFRLQREERQRQLTGDEEFGPPISFEGVQKQLDEFESTLPESVKTQVRAYDSLLGPLARNKSALGDQARLFVEMRESSKKFKDSLSGDIGKDLGNILLQGVGMIAGTAIQGGNVGGAFAAIGGQLAGSLTGNLIKKPLTSALTSIAPRIGSDIAGAFSPVIGGVVGSLATSAISGLLGGNEPRTAGGKARKKIDGALEDYFSGFASGLSGDALKALREANGGKLFGGAMDKTEFDARGDRDLWQQFADTLAGTSKAGEEAARKLAGAFDGLGLSMYATADSVGDMLAQLQGISKTEADMQVATAGLLSTAQLTDEALSDLAILYGETAGHLEREQRIREDLLDAARDYQQYVASGGKPGTGAEFNKLKSERDAWIGEQAKEAQRQAQADAEMLRALESQGLSKSQAREQLAKMKDANDIGAQQVGLLTQIALNTGGLPNHEGRWPINHAGRWPIDKETQLPMHHQGKMVGGYPSSLSWIRDDESIVPPEKAVSFSQTVLARAGFRTMPQEELDLLRALKNGQGAAIHHDGYFPTTNYSYSTANSYNYNRRESLPYRQQSPSGNTTTINVQVSGAVGDFRDIARKIHGELNNLRRSREVAA